MAAVLGAENGLLTVGLDGSVRFMFCEEEEGGGDRRAEYSGWLAWPWKVLGEGSMELTVGAACESTDLGLGELVFLG